MYVISLLSKVSPKPQKIHTLRENTTLFPTRPVFWIPDLAVPRIEQNTARWPEILWVTWSNLGIPNSLGCSAHL